MTRPKAETDPWLVDPISRDRVIAKTVVEGIRQMIGLLRGIRDDLQGEMKAAREERRQNREEMAEMWRRINGMAPSRDVHRRQPEMPPCGLAGCTLPDGHYGNHRGSIRNA